MNTSNGAESQVHNYFLVRQTLSERKTNKRVQDCPKRIQPNNYNDETIEKYTLQWIFLRLARRGLTSGFL